jgi:hypothetical protein
MMFVTALALPTMYTLSNVVNVLNLESFDVYNYATPRNHKINVIFITEHGNYSWALVTQNGTTYDMIGEVDEANMTIICDYYLAKKIMNSPHPIVDIIDALNKGQIIVINPGNEAEEYFMKCLKHQQVIF